jgi:hypothetical protein
MKTFKANSKVVDQAWYSPETRILSVRLVDRNIAHFKKHGTVRKDLRPKKYLYVGVPQYIYNRFAKAKSKGRFFSANIRDKYLYQKDAFTLGN